MNVNDNEKETENQKVPRKKAVLFKTTRLLCFKI